MCVCLSISSQPCKGICILARGMEYARTVAYRLNRWRVVLEFFFSSDMILPQVLRSVAASNHLYQVRNLATLPIWKIKDTKSKRSDEIYFEQGISLLSTHEAIEIFLQTNTKAPLRDLQPSTYQSSPHGNNRSTQSRYFMLSKMALGNRVCGDGPITQSESPDAKTTPYFLPSTLFNPHPCRYSARPGSAPQPAAPAVDYRLRAPSWQPRSPPVPEPGVPVRPSRLHPASPRRHRWLPGPLLVLVVVVVADFVAGLGMR